MDNFALLCRCGHTMKISVRDFGRSGTCPVCSEWLTPGPKNTEPLHLYEARTRAAANPNLCLKCAKPFRGDWDKVSTPEGIVCHHCSVRAVDGIPLPPRAPAPPVEVPKPIVEIEVKKRLIPLPEIDTESPGFKRVVLIAGLSVVVFTVSLLLFGDFEMPEEGPSYGAEGAAVELPAYTRMVVLVWQAFAIVATVFVALYLALRSSNRLPHDSFPRNSAYLSLVVLVQIVLTMCTYYAVVSVEGIFVAGQIWSMLITPVGFLVQVIVLCRMVDFGFYDFIRFLFYNFLVGIAVEAVSVAFYGIFYLIVT